MLSDYAPFKDLFVSPFTLARPFCRTDLTQCVIDDCREKLAGTPHALQHYYALQPEIDAFLRQCAESLMVWTANQTTLTTSVFDQHDTATDIHRGHGILHLAIDSMTRAHTRRQPRYMARTGYLQLMEEYEEDRQQRDFVATDIQRFPLAPQATWFDEKTHALFNTFEQALLTKGYTATEEAHHFKPLFPTQAEVRYARLRKPGNPTVILQTCLGLH